MYHNRWQKHTCDKSINEMRHHGSMDTIQFPMGIPVNPGFSLRESRNQTTDKQMSADQDQIQICW